MSQRIKNSLLKKDVGFVSKVMVLPIFNSSPEDEDDSLKGYFTPEGYKKFEINFLSVVRLEKEKNG